MVLAIGRSTLRWNNFWNIRNLDAQTCEHEECGTGNCSIRVSQYFICYFVLVSCNRNMLSCLYPAPFQGIILRIISKEKGIELLERTGNIKSIMYSSLLGTWSIRTSYPYYKHWLTIVFTYINLTIYGNTTSMTMWLTICYTWPDLVFPTITTRDDTIISYHYDYHIRNDTIIRSWTIISLQLCSTYIELVHLFL